MDEEDSLANALELDAAAKAFYENRDRTDMFCRDCLAERDAVLAEVG
jgi:hypothetical protein